MRTFRKLEGKGYIPIIGLDKIKPDKVKLLHNMFDLEGRVVSTNGFMNVLLLNDYKIQALLVPNNLDEEILRRVNFPVIPTEEIEKEEIDEVTVAKKKEFDEKLKKARKLGFIQWINGHKKRRL